VGDLLDVLGLPRYWPELFDVMEAVLDSRASTTKREGLASLARKTFGG
jgi:hypothetical protein